MEYYLEELKESIADIDGENTQWNDEWNEELNNERGDDFSEL